MNTKSVVWSKMNFVNLLVAVAAALELLTEGGLVPDTWIKWILFGVALINIVLRTWYTETKLTF